MTGTSTPVLILGLTFLAGLPFCSKEVEGDAPGECADGVDNDHNGIVDCDDPGCSSAMTCMESQNVLLGHCNSGEATYFNCTVKSGKILSLCGAPDQRTAGAWLQYRFGRLGNIGREWPDERSGSLARFRYFSAEPFFGPRTLGRAVYHDSGPHRFAVFAHYTMQESSEDDGAGVVVIKNGRVRSTPTCINGSVQDNLEVLSEFLPSGDEHPFY